MHRDSGYGKEYKNSKKQQNENLYMSQLYWIYSKSTDKIPSKQELVGRPLIMFKLIVVLAVFFAIAVYFKVRRKVILITLALVYGFVLFLLAELLTRFQFM